MIDWGNWVAGDVAYVPGIGRVFAATDGIWRTPVRGTNTPWRDLNDGRLPFFDIRPLVVIDPEDREQVARLLRLFDAEYGKRDERTLGEKLVDALREFANPKPPKPDEPMGLGAVVEDADGTKWIRHAGALAPWHRADAAADERSWRYFVDIDAVRVLSDGVTGGDA